MWLFVPALAILKHPDVAIERLVAKALAGACPHTHGPAPAGAGRLGPHFFRVAERLLGSGGGELWDRHGLPGGAFSVGLA